MAIPNCSKTLIPETFNLPSPNKISSEKQLGYPTKRGNLKKVKTKLNGKDALAQRHNS